MPTVSEVDKADRCEYIEPYRSSEDDPPGGVRGRRGGECSQEEWNGSAEMGATLFILLRVVFRETMVIQMKNQTVEIKVLLYQNIQCINILAQAPDTQIVGYFCMTMSRTTIIYNQFYNC